MEVAAVQAVFHGGDERGQDAAAYFGAGGGEFAGSGGADPQFASQAAFEDVVVGERESEVDEGGETFGGRVAVGALCPAFQACFGEGEGVGERVGQRPVKW
ncbi:hypothetical protein ACFC5Z_04275 [Streptomyces sp. NPDC056004]|uniref:hypothetical protein n=1 Tax=unclassified Streptomyces TaxID=2593676 RepID=UPI0035E184DE